MKWIVGILTVIILLAGGMWLNSKKVKTFTVQRVIDGDSFVIDNNQNIRLASVNAPEENKCGFTESKEALEKMILNKKVRITGNINDDYGRFLASVYLNNIFVNEEMARLGWVKYTSQNTDERDLIKIAGVQARKEKNGIYGICLQETNTKNPKCLIKGNNNEKKEKRYFLPECKTYTSTDVNIDLGDEWFCTEKEALAAGYVKALNCK